MGVIDPCIYVHVFPSVVLVRTKQCYITQCSQLMLALTLNVSPWSIYSRNIHHVIHLINSEN